MTWNMVEKKNWERHSVIFPLFEKITEDNRVFCCSVPGRVRVILAGSLTVVSTQYDDERTLQGSHHCTLSPLSHLEEFLAPR
jgi:hypothetical protein